ncbi:thiamine phosphate synthase [Candidatus Pelagibacter sp.]|nr:thiamine phosphate synthase [Candidatus Pelagibacter sp.]
MKINKKKFIYLISPNKIYPKFYKDLKKVLDTGKIGLFQLRLKKYSLKQKIEIGKKIHRICKKTGVKFLVNDDPSLSKKLNADGCHLGQKDMSVKNARKIIGNKIIGITCHNSIRLAKAAIIENVSYIAFGAFFCTATKKVKFKANTKILKEIKKLTNIPIVAIGGINFDNYKKLLLNNADLLAISGYVWSNKKYKPIESIKKLK